ncbi:hypothetical protein FKF78_06600 [Aeromonas hydrophila]|jgi:hypothetical protein|uniref:Uncharacterized protein n=1 Tax=Aeromonas hydrophila TaxID=644 RepID=A0AAD3UDS1_AERHY|nr:hypothetical protein VU14_08895 [Aeromonas hydrophila]ANT67630.1 hypothetical protein TK34_09185 [Aeromonas hydrophila]AVP84263.1 hypothetical protein C7K70_09445 [Aeromonas hydrophila]KER63301.1 hypothetical protein HR52_10010 [Aeromonas hydrophila]KWR67280.1 hypothetical protein ATO50_14555 [Aeromonas hydrophila]
MANAKFATPSQIFRTANMKRAAFNGQPCLLSFQLIKLFNDFYEFSRQEMCLVLAAIHGGY